MWNNVGKKIKTVIKILFWIFSVLFVIGGIVTMAINENYILYGLLSMLIGPLLTWISSWIMYGFGELIENSAILAKNSDTTKHQNVIDEKIEKRNKLEKLYSQGMITEEEYNIALKKL